MSLDDRRVSIFISKHVLGADEERPLLTVLGVYDLRIAALEEVGQITIGTQSSLLAVCEVNQARCPELLLEAPSTFC
jgi:hypothetical protein